MLSSVHVHIHVISARSLIGSVRPISGAEEGIRRQSVLVVVSLVVLPRVSRRYRLHYLLLWVVWVRSRWRFHLPQTWLSVNDLLHPKPQPLIFEEQLLYPLLVVVTVPVVLLLPLFLPRLLDLIQILITHILHPYHHLPKDTHDCDQDRNLSQRNQKSLLKIPVKRPD